MYRSPAQILRKTPAVSLHQAEVIVRFRQSLRGGKRVPLSRKALIFAHAQSVLVRDACIRRNRLIVSLHVRNKEILRAKGATFSGTTVKGNSIPEERTLTHRQKQNCLDVIAPHRRSTR